MKNKTISKAQPLHKKDEPDPANIPETQLRSEVCVSVNPPFRGQQFAANKKLTPEDFEKFEQVIGQDERLQFAVVGDLNLKNHYARSVLAVTDKRLYGFDETLDSGVNICDLSQIKSACVKRYYSNAMLIFTMADADGEKEDQPEKRINFLRFSYREAIIFDAAATFISNVAAGNDIEEERIIAEIAFEKLFSVCPKCGRTLLRPGAPCMNCQVKGKFLSKLAKYILPLKWVLLMCLLLSVVTTGMSLVPPYMTRMLVDDVLPNRSVSGLITCVVVLLFAHLVQYGVGTFRAYHLKISGDKAVAALRNDVYEKAQRLPMRFYDNTSTGSIINRISGDCETIQSFILRISQEVVVQLFLLVGIVIIMFAMNWKLALLTLIPVPLIVTGSRIFRKKIRPFYRRLWRRWSAVTGLLTDTIPSIRVIKAFANEKKTVDKFMSYNTSLLKTHFQASKIITLFPNVVGFFISCGSLLIWGIGGSQVINNPDVISPGLLVSFISYTSMFYGPVNFFANLNDAYQNALNSAERLMDIMDAEPENDFAAGKHPEKLKGKIEFRNVNFSFERAKKTLTDINFVIEPGDIVGIVGTTGAGKSTLINLLMRYYDHYEGEILVDDINIRDIDMTFYRSELGYVQQEPTMFHDSIYQNIAFGSDNVQVEEVLHAADVANAHSFIARLPDGYDTVLGERGIGLSGGERQRLSIARAVLKNPSILLFDEATASVDSETEHLIQEAIENLIHGRTTLMIAHRLSTLRRANKIIVVDKGKILEMGTPEELLEKKGKYYKLVQIQTMSAELEKTKKEERFE